MIQKTTVMQAISHRDMGKKLMLTHSSKLDRNNTSSDPMEDHVIVEPDLLSNGEYAFFAVLDGHGGPEVARYISLNFTDLLRAKLRPLKNGCSIEDAIKTSLVEIERKMAAMNMQRCGTTFCGIFIDRVAKEVIVVNVGDSRLLQVVSEESNMLSAGFLTTSHKTTNFEEVRRIMMNSGMVFNGRVGGVLNMTRSIGDFGLKKFGLSSEPEIHRYSLDSSSVMLLASDGIWDYVKVDDVLEALVTDQPTCSELCDVLVKESIKKGSRDNISIICIVAE